MRSPSPRAFTLIEAAAVLVLVGLMASAATLSLRSAYRGSQMKDVVSRIKSLDQSARRITQISGKPGVIQIDQSAGKISFVGDEDMGPDLLPVVLPGGYRLRDVHVTGMDTSKELDRITCSADGQTPSYAFTLSGPNEQSRLLVFAGMSGQITDMDNDEDFDIDNLLSPRPDTD